MKKLFWSRLVGDFVNKNSGKSANIGCHSFTGSEEEWWECLYETCLDTVPHELRDMTIHAGEPVWLDSKVFLRLRTSKMFRSEISNCVLRPSVEIDDSLGNLVEVFYKDQFVGTVSILERGL